MFGITSYMIRCVCESGMGGYMLTPAQIGQMTPDQFWLLACNRDVLKRNAYGRRETVMHCMNAIALADEDGKIKGRAADGSEIRMPMNLGGKSVVQFLREKQLKEKQEQEAQKKSRRRRRK